MDSASGFQIGTLTLGSLAGIVIGAFLGHVLTNLRWKREHHREAKDRFRSEFEADLVELRDLQMEPYDILKGSLPRHMKAKAEFERYLKGRTLFEFNAAWDEYYHFTFENGQKIPHLEQYFSAGSIDKRTEMRKLAIERLERLLYFAQPLK